MDRDEADRDAQHESGLEPKHKIFLNHSGAQKSFVETLCVQLEGVRRFAFFDKCSDCLPWGERFPEAILAAARQCQVAVVVLSEEYFTRSKWPMIELVVFMQQPESSIKIIPLFFKISLSDLRDPERQRRWESKWEAWAAADKRIKLPEWKDALKRLRSFKGMEYIKRGADSPDLEDPDSLKEYLDKVVDALVKDVNPDVLHGENAGDIQGRRRFCQEIRAKLEEPGGSGVRVVGFYGMGGIGKTTFCKLLCDGLEKEFSGKVCHVELGHQTSELELLKRVIGSLTNTADSRGFRSWTESQCLNYLSKELRRKPAFLALDNVSLESLRLALKFLQLGFHEKSTVLVPAHTHDILASHLKIDSSNCLEMPHLTEDEATKLFLKHAARDNPSLKCEDNYDRTIQQCVQKCYFSKGDAGAGHHYHPLALLVLGEQLQSKEFSKWLEILQEEPDIFNLFGNKTHPVFSIFYRSYRSLLENDQLMFLDVALFIPEEDDESGAPGDVISWLSSVYAMNSTEVRNRLEHLRTRGMLNNFDAHSCSIGMHDLFRELAQMEAKLKDLHSRACVYDTRSVIELKKRRREDFCSNISRIALVERYDFSIFYDDSNIKYFADIRWDCFPNLFVLKLIECDILPDHLNLTELKYLRSLDVWCCRLLTQLPGLRELKYLTYLRLARVPVCEQTLDQLPVSLEHLHLQDIPRLSFPLNLDHCSNLLELTFGGEEVDRFPDLSKLTSLQKVRFECISASVVEGLNSSLSRLESLMVSVVHNYLFSCPNLDTVTRLEYLDLRGVDATELDFQNFTCLERLNISGDKLTRVSGLENLTKLRKIFLRRCSALLALDNVRRLPALQVLDLQGCGNLRSLKVYDCAKLSECLGLRDLTALEELHLSNVGLEEIPPRLYPRALPDFGRLRILSLRGCTELKSLKDIELLPALQSLDLSGCSKLEELPGLRSSRALESLDISQTAVRLRFRDVYNLACMPVLSLFRSVEEALSEPTPDNNEMNVGSPV